MIESADLTPTTWTGPEPSGGTPSSVSPFGEALVTADVVAAHLGVDVSCVYRMARSGALPVVVLGRAKRFRVADILAFVAAATRGSAPTVPVDRVQQLLRAAPRRPCPPRSNDLDASRRQSVHRAPKQEPWRAPGTKPEDN